MLFKVDFDILSKFILQQGESEFLFPTPLHSIWQIILQTADGPDSEFFSNPLSYQIMTYTLFIVFIIAVPVLFNNFLVSKIAIVKSLTLMSLR